MLVTKLKLGFSKASGEDFTLNYSNVDEDVTTQNVKDLMSGIIANGAIFTKVPAVAKNAFIITTETTAVDLSD